MRKYTAEALGTFAVVFTGLGAMAVGGERLGLVGVAIAFGVALGAMTLALAPLSGAHLNPAVSVAMAIGGRLAPRELLPYVAAQLAGGTAGAGLAVTMAQGRPGGGALVARAVASGWGRGSPGYYGLGSAAVAEIGLTAMFAFVVLAVASRGGAAASRRIEASPTALAAAAGLAYGLVHLVGLPVSNVAANPARAIGPALLAGGESLSQLWLFVAAPVAGGVLAALAHRAVYGVPSVAPAPSAPAPAPAPSTDRA